MILAKQLVCQKYIFKLHSSRLRKAKWRLTLPVAEARKNDEVISLADSQVLRWLDELNGITDAENRAREIKMEIRRLRKEPNSVQNRRRIKQLYADLDDVQFKPDYLCVIIDKEKDYHRACRGFSINGIQYQRLLGTNGGVKNETIVFISDRHAEEIKKRIDNGRNMDKEMVPAKLEAYKALTCSASIPVSMPHGIGESTTDPATEVTVSGVDEFAKGDVVTYNAKEYVYDGATWRELGDESSFAVKGSIKDTDIAADAAIAQSKIAGLETALAAKATPADITTAIEGLDVADEAVSGQVVSAVVETDGKIAVSRRALVADDIPTLAIAKVEGLQDALDGKAVESDITDAIAALDVEDSAVDGQVVSAVAETDGKITVTRRALVANDIPELAQNKITGLTTALAGKQDNITFETAYDASTNKAATMTDVDAAETAAKEYTDTALTWGSF